MSCWLVTHTWSSLSPFNPLLQPWKMKTSSVLLAFSSLRITGRLRQGSILVFSPPNSTHPFMWLMTTASLRQIRKLSRSLYMFPRNLWITTSFYYIVQSKKPIKVIGIFYAYRQCWMGIMLNKPAWPNPGLRQICFTSFLSFFLLFKHGRLAGFVHLWSHTRTSAGRNPILCHTQTHGLKCSVKVSDLLPIDAQSVHRNI